MSVFMYLTHGWCFARICVSNNCFFKEIGSFKHEVIVIIYNGMRGTRVVDASDAHLQLRIETHII